MKKIYTILVIALLSINVFSQVPNWEWAKSAGGTSNELVNGVCTDSSGNVFMTGYFSSSTITFGTTTLTNAGNTDIFIVKYDGTGNVVWAKSAGGTDNEICFCVTTDVSGNVFMTGIFYGTTITFGNTTLTNTSSGSSDIFIVKYDASGNVIWAKSEGAIGDDISENISLDTNGNIFITGYFDSSVITFGTSTLTNAGLRDVFIAKYDSLGNDIWAKSAGGNSSDLANSVSTDASGNVFISGSFYSSAITFGSTTLTNTGNDNFFIAKYDSSGNAIWAKSAGSDFDNYGTSVSTDAAGNTIFVGSFESPTITFGTTILANAGGGADDIFIVKYDSSGNVVWAKSAGEIQDDRAYGVTTDASGNIIITGFYGSPVITFGTTTLTNSGLSSIFVVKYDASGNMVWVKSAGGTNGDSGRNVATDAGGNIFIAGFFGSPNITFGTTTLTNGGVSDIFIAKIKNNCFAYYTTTYDSVSNNFTLMVDSVTTSFANTYHWDFGDGTTSTLPTPSHVYTVDTVYNVCMKIYTALGDSCEYCHVIGKDYLGNIYRTAGFTINVVNHSTSISENKPIESTITISPNPFTSQTTITFNEEHASTGSTGSPTVATHTIIITDILGKEIKTIHFTGKQCVLEKGEMERGIYFVEITDSSASSPTEKKNVVNRKIVLQ